MTRSRTAPELVTTYSVSEYESPVSRVQSQEAFEDDLDIQELFVAPSLPRRPDYHRNNESDYRNQRAKARAPPTLDVYPGEHGRVNHRPPVSLHSTYDYDRRRGHDWRQQSAASPRSGSSSSSSSALDCGRCAYTEPRRRYDNSARTNVVSYNIIPGGSVGRKTSLPPAHTNAAHYTHEAPRFHRLHDFRSPPPPREGLRADRSSSIANAHNQVVLYRDATQSNSSEGRLAFDEMHSNESTSSGWSTRVQQHLSGSETQSDVRSESQLSSLDGLYEEAYPRSARQTRPPARVRPSFPHQRPVIITRSDDDDSEECSDSSSDLSSGGYYRRDYARGY
jgi:hypothetical protein